MPPHNLPKILLVEDSETSAALVARYLRDQYRVLHASDGIEAWDMLGAETDIDLVLTDVQMPRLNGHELLGRIRASDLPQLKDLAVIVMTTADNAADRQLAFANGASDFVGKPLNPPELQARVRVHQQLAQARRELEASRRSLEEKGSTDPLMRLRNQREFAEIGARHFALARRHRHHLALVVLDIDQFRQVNDSYGPSAGDRVLIGVGQILATGIRAGDVCARVGGEEFAVLLPGTNRAGAARLAERLCGAVKQARLPNADGAIAVTASAGVACYGPDAPESLEQLIKVADRRLSAAKRSGPDHIVA